jgi:uncharacterized Fe-S cluster-containing protein
MFAIRPINGTTRWSAGKFNKKLNCYIKYNSEYENALHYKNKLNLIINNYYIKEINKINDIENYIIHISGASDTVKTSLDNKLKSKMILEDFEKLRDDNINKTYDTLKFIDDFINKQKIYYIYRIK